MDDRAVQILLQMALKKKKKREEEREEKRRQEVAEHERRMRVLDRRVWANEELTPEESLPWRAWAGHLPGGKRKRKKRRKRKLPKSSSSGCRRPCALQRGVPAVQRVDTFSAAVHRRLLDIHVVQQRQVRGLMDLKTVVVPQLQFIKVVDTLFVTQRLISMVLVTMAIPQLLLHKVVIGPVMLVVQVATTSLRPSSLAVARARLVLRFVLLGLCSLLCREAQDARHHGRFVPEEALRGDFSSRSSTSLSWRRGFFTWSSLSADHPVCSWCEFHRCRRGEDSRAPTVALVEKLDAFPDLCESGHCLGQLIVAMMR